MFTDEEVDKMKKNALDMSDYKSHEISVTESVLMVLIVVGFFTFLYALGYALWQFWGDSSQPEPVVHVLQETVPGTTTNIIINNQTTHVTNINPIAGQLQYLFLRMPADKMGYMFTNASGVDEVFTECENTQNCGWYSPYIPMTGSNFRLWWEWDGEVWIIPADVSIQRHDMHYVKTAIP